MARSSVQKVSEAFAGMLPYVLRGARLDFLFRRGVTHAQFLVLAAVRGYRDCRMRDLARNLRVSMPAASRMVDRLVRQGYLRRFNDPGDRRQVGVEVTARGLSLIRDFQEAVGRRWREVLGALDEDELSLFHRALLKMRGRLEKEWER